MSWLDDFNKFISPNPTSPWSKAFTPERYSEAIKTENQAKLINETNISQAELIKAQGEAQALSKGYTLEQNLLGSTTRAGVGAQAGQSTGYNFLDILKGYSQSPAINETGKAGTNVLEITPPNTSQTSTDSSGSKQTVSKQPDTTILGGWLPLILIIGIILIAIVMLRK